MSRDPLQTDLDPTVVQPGSVLQAVLRRVNRDEAADEAAFRHLRRRVQSAPQGQQQTSAIIDAALHRRTQVLLAPTLPSRLTRDHPFDLPWARLDEAVDLFPGATLSTESSLDPVDLSWPAYQEGQALGGLKSFMFEDSGKPRFGTGAGQLADAATLSVDLARQHGTRELYWHSLTNAPADATAETLEWTRTVYVPADAGEIED